MFMFVAFLLIRLVRGNLLFHLQRFAFKYVILMPLFALLSALNAIILIAN